MKPKTIILLILLALFLVFLLQNTEVVQLKFLFWKVEMSRIIFFPLTLLVGIIIGYVLTKVGKKKEKQEKRSND